MTLSGFRINTITEPTEVAPIAAGLAQTTDPVIRDYFERKIEYDNIKHDIGSLQAVIASVARDSVPNDALLQIPSVTLSGLPGEALHTAFNEFYKAQNDLATHRIAFTDDHPIVKADLQVINRLKRERIPQLARELLTSLRTRASQDSLRIASAGVNLQKIPERTIEEERLRRRREVAAGMFANLQNRAAEAQLAEAAATPDVTVLDSAIAPFAPSTSTAWRKLFVAIAGGFGAAIALAILLDKLDGRFRYPEQSTEDLGLPIAGTVPQFPKGGLDQRSTEQMFQLVESFRTLRMSVLHASNGGVSLAVSSAAPGEGKSLIAANLAMSFADAGLRTILVDGDTRRGTLHEMFGIPNTPGLTDYLAGTASAGDVVLATTNPQLFVLACGTRLGRSPELLTSPRLRELVSDLRSTFDAVIFDTPPLAAGIDGYSIATAAGALVVVLRVGQTKRRMAAEKLRVLDRLPVTVIGSVLNGVDFRDGYEYYGYVPGYEAEDEPGTAVTQVT
jgi:tyrosine-protein kinase Etk/Wzc